MNGGIPFQSQGRLDGEVRRIALVHCETCGHAYDGLIERCPKCRSNQRGRLIRLDSVRLDGFVRDGR
jgi:uncharacterized OB-fold protein